MQKRAMSQIDWIMSLAIFLLYVIWFFIFISPSLTFGTNKDSLIQLLEEEFENEFSWQLERFPLFIEYNDTLGMKAIIFNYTVNDTDIKFIDGTDYVIWDRKMFLLANITSNITTYWFLQGGNYTKEAPDYKGLSVSEDSVSAENFTVKFSDYMPEEIHYIDEEKMENMVYRLNGIAFSDENTTYNDSGFMSMHSAGTGNINHTTIVFAEVPEAYFFITAEDHDAAYQFEIDIDLDAYDSYFSDNNNFGDFEYISEKQYLNYTHDSITLYDAKDAVTMFFDSDAAFNFTYYNTTLDLNVAFAIDHDYEYSFIFHQGDYSNIGRERYSHRFGAAEPLSGIYLSNITTNYTKLRTKWGFPGQRNFNIRVYLNSSAYIYLRESPDYEIGSSPNRKINIFAKTSDMRALDSEGEFSPISASYRIW